MKRAKNRNIDGFGTFTQAKVTYAGNWKAGAKHDKKATMTCKFSRQKNFPPKFFFTSTIFLSCVDKKKISTNSMKKKLEENS